MLTRCTPVLALIALSLVLAGNFARDAVANEEALEALKELRPQVERDSNGDPEVLGLRGVITDDHLETVSKLTSLSSLTLEQNRVVGGKAIPETKITPAGLAKLRSLMDLKELNIYSIVLNDSHLAQISKFGQLTSLNFTRPHVSTAYGPTFTDAGLKSLTLLTNLEELSLGSCPNFTDLGLKHVGGLTKLRVLNLSSTKVTDKGLIELGVLRDLQELDLYRTRVSDLGVAVLGTMPQLQQLNLGGTRLTDEGMASIAKLPLLGKFWCSSTAITDEGFSRLKDHKMIYDLNLFGTRITDASIEQIKGYDQLSHINIYRSKISAEGAKEIEKKFPKARVFSGFKD